MNVNQRLRHARELRGWSQARVARAVGIDPVTVSRWERGISVPYPHFREKLCELFGMSAQELGLPIERAEQEDGLETVQQAEPAPPAVSAPISDPAIPFVSANSVGLVGRDTLIDELKSQLCAGKSVALHGLPGVGKTALAIQLAHDAEVLQHFAAGILWVEMGIEPDVKGQLCHCTGLLGVSPRKGRKPDSCAAWTEALYDALDRRKILMIIDDIWQREDAQPFMLGGKSCVRLITTRFPHVARYFAENAAIQIHELGEEDGLALLGKFVPDIVRSAPLKAQELVRAVGGLPLAITLMGKHLRLQSHSRQPRRVHMALEQLQHPSNRLRLSEPYPLVERHSSLTAESALSLEALIAVSDQLLSGGARTALRALALFPAKPNSFSCEAALYVCNRPHAVLDTLLAAGLLEMTADRRYMVHPTIADYANLHRDEEGPCGRFVEYFVRYVRAHKSDGRALLQEYENIQAALTRASTLACSPESFSCLAQVLQHLPDRF